MRRKPTKHQRVCVRCAATFFAWPYKIRAGEALYCSVACHNAAVPAGDRFWLKVRRGEGCWPYEGPRDQRGYGRFSIGPRGAARLPGAHRLAWELTNGPIPDDLFVCHRCDNPSCCNPAHLFLGTSRENNADMVAKGRQARGEKHGSRTRPEARRRGSACSWAGLTESQVTEMRRLYATGGVGYGRLAAHFGTGYHTVWDVIHRRTWAHLP